jgi:hypothetical protein
MSVLMMMIMMMMVVLVVAMSMLAVLPVFPLRLVLRIVDAQRGQQLSSLDRIVHHSLVRLLLLLLDRQQRILSDFCRRISRHVDVLHGHEALLAGLFLELLVLVVLQEPVQAALPQEKGLALGGIANLSVRRASRVHPLDPVPGYRCSRGL